MRTIAAALLALALCLACTAASAAPAASPTTPAEDLTLSFVPLDGATRGGGAGAAEAVLDLGTISAAGRHPRDRATVRRQRIAIRLDSPSGRVASARLEAFLGSEAAGCTVRVDGVLLSTIPRLLDPVHRLGTPVLHEIEVSVASSAAEGALLSDVQWVAESN